MSVENKEPASAAHGQGQGQGDNAALRHPVGVIGAGNMGGAVVERLCELGWPVVVRDIAAAAVERARRTGARTVDTAVEVAQAVRSLIVLVVNAAEVQQVLFEERLIDALQPGSTVFLCPTLGPLEVETFAAALAERSVHLVDAPVSGGPVRARAGAMSLMLAGDAAVLDAHAGLIDAMSNQVFRISARPGDASRTKLVNNMLAAVNLAAAAEGLALARHWGLDPAQTLSVIEQSSGQSWIGSDRLRRALVDDYAPRAHTTLLAKDTRLALEAAEAAQRSVPLAALAAILFAKACAEGYDVMDDASLYRMFDRA